ncbi:MAG: selenocysteine-specific translation elongation factor [Chloroflexota bacterium]
MYVIGTAGHVDHGKSTLVKALTGIDPDRLAEEKRREMTIDLGFAWLKLPSGQEISLVDVPGHERFIKNMLAGVGGIDAVLLVIAADEGIMPQTVEHLAILDLLQIQHGVVALTKCDLVDDEWLELMREEIKEGLSRSGLAEAPLVPVSARSGKGLKELLKTLDSTLTTVPLRPDLGKPRLPIDRVFTISGFGTVVTGTLIEGRLTIGQEVEIQPGGLKSRIRSLQMHQTKAEIAPPGNRVAVNLVGLEVSELHRGMVLTTPNWLEATDRIDVRLTLLLNSPLEIVQNSRYDLFSGASETRVGVTILDKERLLPGESGLLQFRLAEPLALAKGDRFILRLPSPSQTIGGGIVLDTQPRRHKRFQEEVITTLQILEQGTPTEILLQHLNTGEGWPRDLKTLIEETTLALKEIQVAVKELVKEGNALLFSEEGLTREAALKAGEAIAELPLNQPIAGSAAWQRLKERAVALVQQYHHQFPLKRGINREELKSRLGISSPKTYNLIIHRLGREAVLVERKSSGGMVLSLPNFKLVFNPAQQKQADALLEAFRREPYLPPSLSELGTDPQIIAALVDEGELQKISESVYFLTEAYNTMLQEVLSKLDQNGKITLAEVRDRFKTSRKPVQALLEYLDDQKITRRVGDERVKW